MPPDLLPKVVEYIDYLINKQSAGPQLSKPFDFGWEGSLIELSKEYSSVTLQHKALELR